MSTRVRGYHLPGIEEQLATGECRFGAVDVTIPRLRPVQLQGAMQAARAAAARDLRTRRVADVLHTIDRVVANWMRADYHLRQVAERVLPAATGFSVEMIRHGLPLLLESLRGESIRALLNAELGDWRVLDGVHGGRFANGPPLITHVLSGNIPGLCATPMLLSLAIKSAVLVKSAAGDPILPALLAASIHEVDEGLGRCIPVVHWRGGDRELEEIAFADADLVVASGSDAAIAAIRGAARTRFVGHGHKISFAVVGNECLDTEETVRELARHCAYDVSLWDQQGCLSPQLCYLERGGRISATRFAELLAEALAHWARELPPRQLSFEEKAQVLRFRQEADWNANGGAVLVSPGAADWSISIEENSDFRPTCLHRCMRIKVVADLSELEAMLLPHRRHLEAAGIAVRPERGSELGHMLARCGVHRICPIGTMQLPPLEWRQGGRPRVGDWVEWTATEERGKVTTWTRPMS